ncbi:MAG: hypothetical protein HYX73_03695 [Acidobacteria bacterium]|nr:hypothetical protein [Acidobacteriota bacterium]
MVIAIKSREDFERLLDALENEVWGADFHNTLLRKLRTAVKKFQREFNQSPTFWKLTFSAHRNAALFRLMRIYDSNSASLSLRNLLDTIHRNQPMFDEPQFRHRLAGNPYVDSLAADAMKPDEVQLAEDINRVSNDDPLVKKLLIWRHTLYAHRNAKNVVVGNNIRADYPLSDSEIEQLIRRACEILKRYKHLFNASIESGWMIDVDDYEFVLECIAGRLKQNDEEKKARQVNQ